MQKNYDVILREASIRFITEASLLFEQENPEQTVMRLQQQLSQLQPGTTQHSQVQAQLQAAQQQLANWQAQQRAEAQQQAAAQQQGPDPAAMAGNAVNAVGMASTLYGAQGMFSAAGDKMKKAGKFAAGHWNKLGNVGKAGVIGGGVALAGLAAWKIKKMKCRKKCQDLGDINQIQQCMQKC
jgi:TolA-binding protein